MTKSTKAQLGNALKTILERKPLSKVTITDITDECGLTRMTFYYHFQDIYDLIEWICVTEAEQALSGKISTMHWHEGLYNIFKLVLSNRHFTYNVYHSVSREHLEKYIYRLTEDIFVKVVDEVSREHEISSETKAFIADFYKYAFVGIIFNWIDSNMKEDPKKITDRLVILIGENISEAIERFEHNSV